MISVKKNAETADQHLIRLVRWQMLLVGSLHSTRQIPEDSIDRDCRHDMAADSQISISTAFLVSVYGSAIADGNTCCRRNR